MDTSEPQSSRPLGAGWVVAQLVLFALILLSPGGSASLPFILIGLALIGLGGLIAVLGVATLGSNLSIFPRPKHDGKLIERGVYGIVRHPIYSGILIGGVGWSLLRASWIAFALTVALLILFDRKSALEERWLAEKHPAYTDYQQRVKKLLPGVY